jgi:hypothetical protein
MGISDEQVEAALTAKPFGAATVRSFIGAGAHDEEVPAIMRAALLAASRVRTAEPVAWQPVEERYKSIMGSYETPEDIALGLRQSADHFRSFEPDQTVAQPILVGDFHERAAIAIERLLATPVPSYADAIRDAAKVARQYSDPGDDVLVDAIVRDIEALSRAPQ